MHATRSRNAQRPSQVVRLLALHHRDRRVGARLLTVGRQTQRAIQDCSRLHLHSVSTERTRKAAIARDVGRDVGRSRDGTRRSSFRCECRRGRSKARCAMRICAALLTQCRLQYERRVQTQQRAADRRRAAWPLGRQAIDAHPSQSRRLRRCVQDA